MKVITPSAMPAEPATSPLFTGEVSRQPILTPEMSQHFNLGIVNFPVGVRNKMHTHSSDQVLFVTAGTVLLPPRLRRRKSPSAISAYTADEKHCTGHPTCGFLAHGLTAAARLRRSNPGLGTRRVGLCPVSNTTAAGRPSPSPALSAGRAGIRAARRLPQRLRPCRGVAQRTGEVERHAAASRRRMSVPPRLAYGAERRRASGGWAQACTMQNSFPSGSVSTVQVRPKS
jgi:hypothetical protein